MTRYIPCVGPYCRTSQPVDRSVILYQALRVETTSAEGLSRSLAVATVAAEPHRHACPESVLTSRWVANDPPLLHLQLGDYFLPGKGNKDNVRAHLDGMFTEAQDARGVILDLRGSGGGTPGPFFEVVSRLIGKPIRNFTRRWYLSDTFRRYHEYAPRFEGETGLTEWESDGGPGRDVIVPSTGPKLPPETPIVCLVDDSTASRSEQLPVMLQESGLATVMGHETAGSDACPVYVQLPNTHWSVTVSVGACRSAKGYDIEKNGVPLDIPVRERRCELGSGRDQSLDQAQQQLGSMVA